MRLELAEAVAAPARVQPAKIPQVRPAAKRVVVSLVVVLASSCGSNTITLHGQVLIPNVPLTVIPPKPECSFPNPIDGIQITIRDGDGNVIGTTTSVATRVTPVSDPNGTLDVTECSFEGTYSVDVPKVAFYSVAAEVEGFTPSSPISYKDLETAGFKFDLVLTELP